MKKSELKKKIIDLEKNISGLNDDIDILLGNNKCEKLIVAMKREIVKNIYQLIWQ